VLISLQELQKYFGYVPQEAIELVADACNVSRADVHGVLTFYHDLHTKPMSLNTVRLCGAEACQAVGARELAEALAENGTIEIETVYCFGNCALGPAAMVHGKLIGRATLGQLIAAVADGSAQ
jgi:formate dehydrogenase subunit gamma